MTTLPRGSCAVCGRNIAIVRSGPIHAHTKRDKVAMSYTRMISTTCRGSGKLPDKIYAPWSDDVAAALNRFQTSGALHPFTCKFDSNQHGGGVLVATASGWICPEAHCTYRQNWAHHFMSTF